MTLSVLQWLSPVVIVASAMIFVAIERAAPYNQDQKIFREGFFLDLIGYGLLQSYALAMLVSCICGQLNSLLGASRFQWMHGWPVWTQVIFFVIWHDLNTYIIHRTQHRFPFLWRTHEAHHSGTSVDWLSGIRSHSLEILLYETVKFAPIIVLGAAPEVPLYRAMFDSTYGMFIHSNWNLRLGWLGYVFNGPQYHRWHHALGEQRAYGKNFATKFSVWDHLWGTAFDPLCERATKYGIEEQNYPKGYFSQHLHCFRKLSYS